MLSDMHALKCRGRVCLVEYCSSRVRKWFPTPTLLSSDCRIARGRIQSGSQHGFDRLGIRTLVVVSRAFWSLLQPVARFGPRDRRRLPIPPGVILHGWAAPVTYQDVTGSRQGWLSSPRPGGQAAEIVADRVGSPLIAQALSASYSAWVIAPLSCKAFALAASRRGQAKNGLPCDEAGVNVSRAL
jgi:hypothetical protein